MKLARVNSVSIDGTDITRQAKAYDPETPMTEAEEVELMDSIGAVGAVTKYGFTLQVARPSGSPGFDFSSVSGASTVRIGFDDGASRVYRDVRHMGVTGASKEKGAEVFTHTFLAQGMDEQ